MSYFDEDLEGSGMPKGNKKAGFVGLMIAKKYLNRTVDDYDPTAAEKRTPELFDADLIGQPSKYIQENLYEQSTRVRRGIQKVKETFAKKTRQFAVAQFVKKYKSRPKIGQLTPAQQYADEFGKFVDQYHRAGLEGVVYGGYTLTRDLMFLHIIKKYKYDCIIFGEDKKSLATFVGFKISDSYKTFSAYDTKINKVVDAFEDCLLLKSNPILIPFTLPKHQNLLIYRPKLNTMSRFEPHGDYTSHLTKEQNELMDAAVEKYFKRKEFDKIFKRKGVPPFQYFKPSMTGLTFKQGFQSFENQEDRLARDFGHIKDTTYDGFCVMWSMFYLELCLKFPNLTDKEVKGYAMDALHSKKGTERFLRTILAYVEDSEKEIKKFYPEFAFSKIDDTAKAKKTLTKAQIEINLNEFRNWFDKEIKDAIRKARTKANTVPRGAGKSCCSECEGGNIESCCSGGQIDPILQRIAQTILRL